MKNTFQHKDRKAFTIVELVIVIAVIAILAAVLIPTFSNIIKKANLSADKQAVREMNQVLAEWEAEHGYAKPADVKQVMQALADRGYNATHWECLTAGYQVYWFREDNRMILYNSTTNEVEYPEEYDKAIFTHTIADAKDVANGLAKEVGQVFRHFEVYNNDYKEAVYADFSLGSTTAQNQDIASFTSSVVTDAQVTSLGSALAKATGDENTQLRSALGISKTADVVINASKELRFASGTGSYTSMLAMNVTEKNQAPELTSTGEIKANLYYITQTIDSGSSDYQIECAKKEAGDLVYKLFVQINEGSVDDDVAVVIDTNVKDSNGQYKEVVIDCSEKEWVPVKYFKGYFGTTNAENPVIIDGTRLTPATGYAETVAFFGSSGKYYVTGFFATVYGDTTIENVLFRNITFDQPASNFNLQNDKSTYSRNTVSIIGAIVDGKDAENADSNVANVVIRNVTVENTVKVNTAACGGGLIGYVGAASNNRALKGKILIEGCTVNTQVTSFDTNSKAQADVGGLIGYILRCSGSNTDIYSSSNYNNSTELADSAAKYGNISENYGYGKNYEYENPYGFEYWCTITVKNCTCAAKVSGPKMGGAVFCSVQGGEIRFEGTNDFSDVDLTGVVGKKFGIGYLANQSSTATFVTVPSTPSNATQAFQYLPDSTNNDAPSAGMRYYNYIQGKGTNYPSWWPEAKTIGGSMAIN